MHDLAWRVLLGGNRDGESRGCDGVSGFSEDQADCWYYGEVYFDAYEGEVAYFDVSVEVACFYEGVHDRFH